MENDTKVFVNLPVRDLERATAFYQKLGFGLNPQFSDENASCIVISAEIYVMLLERKFFTRFTNKEIVDSTKSTEAIVALSAGSRQQVDAMAERALGAGGVPTRDADDHGWMYGRSFQDLDGHQWEIIWMDESERN